ncbi:MAG: hypothetical protein K0R57_3916, partial [Paenibacillaceae bacterium]|jgi:hypothetical protein|nr:hypothetical protein [Paenibacillaceae bacterium]
MRGRKKRKWTEHKSEPAGMIEQDENFYFIAGYTDGGFPYGITWEEYEEEQIGESRDVTEAEGKPIKEMKLTKQQFQKLVNACDMYVEGMESFLNIETGKVIVLQTFDMDEEDGELSETIEEGFNEIYFRIPQRGLDEGFADMMDFAATIEDKKLHSKLMHILSGGKRIFRRFKDALSSDRGQLERYYLFIEERNRKRVSDWMESIHVQLHDPDARIDVKRAIGHFRAWNERKKKVFNSIPREVPFLCREGMNHGQVKPGILLLYTVIT